MGLCDMFGLKFGLCVIARIMWDKEGSGFFGVKGLRDGTKYIHLCYWVIIAEDAVEVSILDAIGEIKKKW